MTKNGVYSSFVCLLGSLFSNVFAELGMLWPMCFYSKWFSVGDVKMS